MTVYPNRPSENQDPWYAAREAYDNAIEAEINKSVRARGILPNGTDLDTLINSSDIGIYTLTSANSYVNLPFPLEAAATLVVEISVPTLTIVHTLTLGNGEGTRMAVRERHQQTISVFSPWGEVLMRNDVRKPSDSILELAKRDSWAAVYDPTNVETQIFSSGYLQTIRDGLKNYPDMVGYTGQSGMLVKNSFGQLDAVYRSTGVGYVSTLNAPVNKRICTIQLVRWKRGKDDTEYLTNYSAGSVVGTVVRGSSTKAFGLSSGQGVDHIRDTEPHIVVTIFNEDNTEVLIDGQLVAIKKSPELGTTMGLTAMGSSQAGTQNFNGEVGPLLIHTNNPSNEVIDRMVNLLSSLTGIQKGPHLMDFTTTAFSMNEEGDVTFTHGNVDSIFPTGIASMTKMMTWYTATTIFSTGELNTLTHDYQAGDDSGAGDFQPGDTMTLSDWAWCAMGPSYDAPNQVVARFGGLRLLNGAPGDPKQRFIDEMNNLWQGFGYNSRPFSEVFFAATLSAREVVDLLKRALSVPWLAQIMKTKTRTVNVTGPNPRTITRSHTIVNGNPYEFPEWLGGKTGTGNGHGHVALAWQNHFSGLVEYTCILNTPAGDSLARYIELRRLMTAVQYSGHNVPKRPSTRPDIGSGMKMTGDLDITDEAGAIRTELLKSGLYVNRTGDETSLIFREVMLAGDKNMPNIIPFSMRPRYTEYGHVTSYDPDTNESKTHKIRITNNGTVTIYGNSSTDVLGGRVTVPIRNGWPENL